MDINEFGRSIITSELPDEMKIQMLGELSKDQSENAVLNKVGRNDPCPCGSEKKIKNAVEDDG